MVKIKEIKFYNMEQIIGSYKEYIVIERKWLEELELQVEYKLKVNEDRPMSESSIEARACLQMIKYIKENNIYNKDFQIKK